MSLDPLRPIVFAGPTVTPEQILQILPDAQILPPVARGDLFRARLQGGQIFLLIDGQFFQGLAVSPREVIEVQQDGAAIWGCSSMGALRAAECWPQGVRGLGLIFRLYRAGVLDTDDEVAVATDPNRNFMAVSEALVNLRWSLARAVRASVVSTDIRKGLIEAAQKMYFPDRIWPQICRRAGYQDHNRSLEIFCKSRDLKNLDALFALAEMAKMRGQGRLGEPRRTSRPLEETIRYPSMDFDFGLSPEALRREFVIWLFGSGRYQRYIWPVLAGDPGFSGPGTPQQRLAKILGPLLQDMDSIALRLWTEMESRNELKAELIHMHAVKSWAAQARRIGIEKSFTVTFRVRYELAVAHELRDWPIPSRRIPNNRLDGAIPMEWIEKYDSDLALARTYAEMDLSR